VVALRRLSAAQAVGDIEPTPPSAPPPVRISAHGCRNVGHGIELRLKGVLIKVRLHVQHGAAYQVHVSAVMHNRPTPHLPHALHPHPRAVRGGGVRELPDRVLDEHLVK